MADLKTATAELEALQLEETRERVRVIRNSRNQREGRRKALEKQLRDTNAMQKASQDACVHKKGGKGKEMWFAGNDSNHAVVKHILSHGPMIVVCQRCGKLWEPPPRALMTHGSSAEDRATYKRLWQEYQAAIAYPTDNETSGARLFEIHREEVV